jgi:hypothetical protein
MASQSTIGGIYPMDFGLIVATHIAKWDLACHAEELNFDRVWFTD